MTVKSGADISKLHPTLKDSLSTIDLLWQAFFPEDLDGMTITSGHEATVPQVHGNSSKHYIVNNKSGVGEAVDIRAKDVQQAKITVFAGIVWTTLTMLYGDIFKIFTEGMLTENSHLHIQLK